MPQARAAGPAKASGAAGPLARSRIVFVGLSLLVFGVAFALRFWDLAAAPVWMDEAFSDMAARLPLKTILFGRIDNHPPLFYALQHLWREVAPGLDALRAPAAIAGGLAVVATSLAVGDLGSRRAGLAAGAWLALSTGHVYFSQDARMYPLLSLGLAVAVWGLVGLAERPERRLRYAALYVLGGAVAVYAQVVALVFLALINLCLLLYAAAERRWASVVLPMLLANLVLGFATLPWLAQLTGAMSAFSGLKAYGPRAAGWFLDNMVGFPGLPGALRKLGALALLALLLFAGGLGWQAGRRGLAIAGLAGLVLYPLALVVLNARTPILENRVFIPCEVAAAVLFGLAAAHLRPRRLTAGIVAAVLLLSLVSTLNEHRMRLKPEDDPQALAMAGVYGFQGAPVLTCRMLPAASARLSAPERPVYFFPPGGPVRAGPELHRALAMSIAGWRQADAVQLARYLGRDADTQANARAILASDKAVVLGSSCDPAAARDFLRSHGYEKVAEPALGQPARPIFGTLWTRLELWRRS